MLVAAAPYRKRMGPAAAGRRSVLAAWAVHGIDRAAVLRAVGERSAAAGLVRAHRPQGREGSLFSLRCKQCRKLPCADRLSGRRRAVRAAQRSDLALDRRLLCSDCDGGGLRLLDAALAQPDAGNHLVRYHHLGDGSDLARRRDLDRARGGAVRPLDRGHRPHLDRRRGRAAVLDDPACDLSPDVRHRLSDQAVHPALGGGRRSTGVRAVPGDRDPDDPDRIDRSADRDPSQRVLRLRTDVPWRTRAPPSAAAVPDRLLHVDFVRRHDRRHPDGPCCPADIQSHHRISAAGRAHAAVPPGLRAADPKQRPIRGARRRSPLRHCW